MPDRDVHPRPRELVLPADPEHPALGLAARVFGRDPAQVELEVLRLADRLAVKPGADDALEVGERSGRVVTEIPYSRVVASPGIEGERCGRMPLRLLRPLEPGMVTWVGALLGSSIRQSSAALR
jgi:hypothetical protein